MAARRLLHLILVGLLIGCGSTPRNPIQTVKEVDVDDERSVGAQVDAAIRAQVPLIDDPVVLGFVQALGQRIVATVEPQPFIYRFRVIRNPNLNAFAIPGGYIYLHSATVLQSASLDELAGVIGHEIAHVKARHYARGSEAAFWPSLLSRAAGLAAAVATGQSGFMAAAEGVNVALQLKYTREFEREADDLGSAFMARAGFDPEGMGRFFERILAADRPSTIEIPPYLYSHPDLEDRIEAVHERAASLTVTGASPVDLLDAFRFAQARLGLLVESGRTRWTSVEPYDRAASDPLLARAEAAAAQGAPLDALALLEQAERAAPGDPRPPFQRAELLRERGSTREAVLAYQRALRLDPSVALAWYRLGDAHKRLGNRHSAVYCYEQAERRFTEGGSLRERTKLAIATLTDPPITEAGLESARGEGRSEEDGTPRFSPTDQEVIWWAHVDRRYAHLRRRIQVSWTEPGGHVVHREQAVASGRHRAESRLPLAEAHGETFGIWRVEATLEDQVLDRQTFHYAPGGPALSSPSR
jgi:predicted Zn-dependent protease